MARSQTARLLAAMDNGAVIVCDCAPYQNWEVTYAPRNPRDPQPWYVAGFHYGGGECKAMTPADLAANPPVDMSTWAEGQK